MCMFYGITDEPTVLLLEKRWRSNLLVSWPLIGWFWFTAAADFLVKQSWFGSLGQKRCIENHNANQPWSALRSSPFYSARKAFNITKVEPWGNGEHTHFCRYAQHKLVLFTYIVCNKNDLKLHSLGFLVSCMLVFTCLRFHSHMEPVTAKLSLECVMREITRHVWCDFDSKGITRRITAACRTAATVKCVNTAKDGGAIRTAPALGPSGMRGAHGEPWLWQTGDGHGLLLSPTILPFCLLYLCDMSSPSAVRDTDLTFRIVPSLPPPPAFGLRRTSAAKGRKVFDSFADDDDSLVRLGGVSLLKLLRAPAVRVFDEDIHPVTPSGWGVCTRRAERSFSPPQPGHHDNLEAAEELCFSAVRSPRLGLVLGIRKCW